MSNRVNLGYWLLLILSLLLIACTSDRNKSRKSYDIPSENNEEIAYGDLEEYEVQIDLEDEKQIAGMIDEFAGHPYDPQLPDEYDGVTDEELEATNFSDIDFLIENGQEYALKNKDEPRFLFALGRAAYFHGRDQYATEFLETASRNGSAAAEAYEGYMIYDNGNPNLALDKMQSARKKGFDDPLLLERIEIVTERIFNPEDFNRPDLIKALYQNDINALKKTNETKYLSQLYIGSIHNTLSENDIIFLVNDPSIFLALDPALSVYEGYLVNKLVSNGAQEYMNFSENLGRKLGIDISDAVKKFTDINTEDYLLIILQATQDAKRLALLYETDRKAFTQIYEGMKRFSQSNR